MKTRVSNHQLKLMLDHLEAASSIDSALSQLYRESVRHIILDLRDARWENAKLAWIVTNMQQFVDKAKQSMKKLLAFIKNREFISSETWALSVDKDLQDSTFMPSAHVMNEAIYPFTDYNTE